MNNDLFLTENQKERNTTYLAIKLNCLKDKQARFVSHKEFLTRCVAEDFVPKRLEPTIDNQNQEFLDNWHPKQMQFSLSFMKDKVQLCNRIKNKNTQDIKSK